MMRSAALRVLLPVALLIGAGCGDARLDRVPVDADEYIRGIQYADPPGVLKRLAPFRAEIATRPPEEWPAIRERYTELVQQRLADYEEAKATGQLVLSEDGISLVQGLALGKGIYYRFTDLQPTDDPSKLVGTMEALPDYSPGRFEVLPFGTRVYLLGEPLGTLRTVTLGDDPEARTLRVVGRAEIEWRLVWFDELDVYPAGWAVESIRPLPDRFEFNDLTRVF